MTPRSLTNTPLPLATYVLSFTWILQKRLTVASFRGSVCAADTIVCCFEVAASALSAVNPNTDAKRSARSRIDDVFVMHVVEEFYTQTIRRQSCLLLSR